MKSVLVLLLLLAATTAAQAGIALLPGSSPQTVKAGQALLPIVAQVTDEHGAPVAGVFVSYMLNLDAITSICDSAATCNVVTDASGRAALPPMIAKRAGHWAIAISAAPFPPVVADITVLPSTSPPVLEPVAGNEQVVPMFGAGKPFVVRVTRDGQPVAGESVRFTIMGAGPFISFPGTVDDVELTDSKGEASSMVWFASAGIGTAKVLAQTRSDASGQDGSTEFTFHIVNSSGLSYYPYKPLWWGGPAQSGWGVAIPQHAEHIFPVYFTYDSANRPKWKAMQGAWVGGVGVSFRGDLYEYSGAPYFAFDTSKVRVVGSTPTLVSFLNRVTSATFALNSNNGNITPPPPTTVLSIQPFDFTPAAPRAELGVSDIWWGGPSQSGWGIHIAEDHGNLFLAWFTYDADGRNTWFAMPEGQWTDEMSWTGPVYRTSGSSQLGDSYDPSLYRATKVGDFTIRFSGTSAATFTYNVDGHSGTLNLQRFDY